VVIDRIFIPRLIPRLNGAATISPVDDVRA
jgi:hypothetical protein